MSRRAALITHSQPQTTAEGVTRAAAAAREAGWELVADGSEYDKHGPSAEGLTRVDALPADAELCIVLGGDGSILYALRKFAESRVPVFAINFGTIGFLAAAEREQIDAALPRAFAGDYEQLEMPGLGIELAAGTEVALNDIAFSRRPHGRIAELSYWVGEEEVGHVRSDGLVVATPAGSTGYNLANGGPILAWGVEGYVVSFISPHTLTARALVAAPGEVLRVMNAAGRDPVDIALDGEHRGELAPGESIEVGFRNGVGTLAQLGGANFYRRIREKFGRVAR